VIRPPFSLHGAAVFHRAVEVSRDC
jgi:hypothetical protein